MTMTYVRGGRTVLRWWHHPSTLVGSELSTVVPEPRLSSLGLARTLAHSQGTSLATVKYKGTVGELPQCTQATQVEHSGVCMRFCIFASGSAQTSKEV